MLVISHRNTFVGASCEVCVKNSSLASKIQGAAVAGNMEDICLKHDNGEDLRFQGRLFSECSHFDEDDNSLTRQQLYLADNGDQVYYIIRSNGQERSRHAYRLARQEDVCIINNGRAQIAMQVDMLLLAVRALCGINADAMPSMEVIEEMLQAANA